MTSKYEKHLKVYMPNWDLLELMTANDMLGLNLSKQDLLVRVSIFGNTAQYTLSAAAKFVKTGREEAETALSKIRTLDDVQECFEGTLDFHWVVLRLMHYIASDNGWTTATLQPASRLIAVKTRKRIKKKLNNQRLTLMHWLDGVAKASAFAGWLFENFVHEILLDGREFEMRSLALADQAKAKTTCTLNLAETHGNYKRFTVEESLEMILLHGYQIPALSNQASVDSYYVSGAGLWLFQITKNWDHDVGFVGLLDVLAGIIEFA